MAQALYLEHLLICGSQSSRQNLRSFVSAWDSPVLETSSKGGGGHPGLSRSEGGLTRSQFKFCSLVRLGGQRFHGH